MTDEKPDAPQTQALAKSEPKRAWSLVPSTLGEANEMATLIANSDFAPRDYKGKPANVLIAIQMGLDVGLKPMQALQNIAIINGRPSIWGDAALALVMPDLERFREFFEGTKGTDDYTAICIAKRRGWPDETRRTFSVADAKKAGLWGKTGPWTNYSDRMQQMRARGFCLRDVAPDRLLGLVLAEEAQDYPPTYPDAIDAVVVSQPTVSLLDGLPEELTTAIGKGFETLALSEAQRAVKLNEFLGGADVVKADGAQALLNWLKDEYAKRKFGKPVDRSKGDNGKKKPEEPKSVGASSTVKPEPTKDPQDHPTGEPKDITPAAEELF